MIFRSHEYCVYNLHILKILIFELFCRARFVFALWGSGVEKRRSLANCTLCVGMSGMGLA